MGSVKFKDLKAYVRYDGSGRVVAGSLVFRKKKPKNGRWSEISSNLCCNASGSTTTTTTQGGGGTPTAWVSVIATTGFTTAWDACNGLGSTVVVYTSVTEITAGTYLYSDAALTTLIPYSGSIAINGRVYDLINGQINPLGGNGQLCSGITTTTSTTTVSGIIVAISYDTMFDPICSTTTTLPIQIVSGTSLSNALTISGDFASLGAYYTPADPNNVMSLPPRFDIRYEVNGSIKTRYFTLTSVGIASGADPMFGVSLEQSCL